MDAEAVQFEDGESDIEINERLFRLIGASGAVTNVVAFGAVGYIVLESIAYGVIVGAFGGVGSYLFLPWFMGLSAVQEGSEDAVGFSAASEQVPASTQLGVLGFGLEAGAIVAIGVGLALETADPLVGGGAAAGTALVIYLVGSTALES